MMDNKEWTISEVIDSFGINGHTWLMFILLGLANIFDGYDFMIVNSTNSYLAASFGLINYETMTEFDLILDYLKQSLVKNCLYLKTMYLQ